MKNIIKIIIAFGCVFLSFALDKGWIAAAEMDYMTSLACTCAGFLLGIAFEAFFPESSEIDTPDDTVLDDDL